MCDKGIVLKNCVSLNLALNFINCHSQILSSEKYIVLTLIHLLGNDYGGQVCLSATDIGEATVYDKRSVQRHVAKLSIRNVIEIENTYVRSKGLYCGPNKYRVMDWAAWVENHE